MPQAMRILALAIMLAAAQSAPASAAEREQVRMVINLVAGVKMPFPERLRNIWPALNGFNSTPMVQRSPASVSTTKFVGVTST